MNLHKGQIVVKKIGHGLQGLFSLIFITITIRAIDYHFATH